MCLIHIYLIAYMIEQNTSNHCVCVCVCSLSVQMAEDSEILEFTAAASDTLEGTSHTQVQLITICIQIKDKQVKYDSACWWCEGLARYFCLSVFYA